MKGLMWFYDDLHCPNPISPLYFDIGGWWDVDGRWGGDCTYMYQRFGAPIGKSWIAKNIGGYVYSAVVPPDEDADKVEPSRCPIPLPNCRWPRSRPSWTAGTRCTFLG